MKTIILLCCVLCLFSCRKQVGELAKCDEVKEYKLSSALEIKAWNYYKKNKNEANLNRIEHITILNDSIYLIVVRESKFCQGKDGLFYVAIDSSGKLLCESYGKCWAN